MLILSPYLQINKSVNLQKQIDNNQEECPLFASASEHPVAFRTLNQTEVTMFVTVDQEISEEIKETPYLPRREAPQKPQPLLNVLRDTTSARGNLDLTRC